MNFTLPFVPFVSPAKQFTTGNPEDFVRVCKSILPTARGGKTI